MMYLRIKLLEALNETEKYEKAIRSRADFSEMLSGSDGSSEYKQMIAFLEKCESQLRSLLLELISPQQTGTLEEADNLESVVKKGVPRAATQNGTQESDS